MSSVNELEQEIAKKREELAVAVGQLVDYANPSKAAERIKANTLDHAASFSNKAVKIFEKARQGDVEAMKTVGIVTGVVGVGALLILRRIFR